jgi:hypothetical protein
LKLSVREYQAAELIAIDQGYDLVLGEWFAAELSELVQRCGDLAELEIESIGLNWVMKICTI